MTAQVGRMMRLTGVTLAATLLSVAVGALTVVLGPSLRHAVAQWEMPRLVMPHLTMPTWSTVALTTGSRVMIPALLGALSLLALAVAIWQRRRQAPAPVRVSPAPRRPSAGTTSRMAKAIGRSGHRHLPVIAALAAAGTPTSVIARQTGLAIDAVHLMLSMTDAPRQVQPPTA